MFTQVTLKNFRTHKNTTVDLHPVTLLIGNNNSGKTNLLSGIQHFCKLVRRGKPGHVHRKVDAVRDLYPFRYRLAEDHEPIGLDIKWKNENHQISYTIEIYKNRKFVQQAGCRERIVIISNDEKKPNQITSGFDQETDSLELRKIIESTNEFSFREKQLCGEFFGDFASTFTYHFQPYALKRLNGQGSKQPFNASEIDDKIDNRDVKIPADLGEEGQNLQKILGYIKENEQRTFSLFLSKMRVLDNSFQGVRFDPKRSNLIWEFDLAKRGTVEEFLPNVVSDGFMKLAAISLLTSLKQPPALIMLEEIENGINPGNINQLMYWIWQATSSSRESRSQFILTSHSPSVLREFSDHPDHVYTVRLDKKNRSSDVRNLNTALDILMGIGTIEDDQVELEENPETHEKLIIIPKYKLAELWYSGTIG